MNMRSWFELKRTRANALKNFLLEKLILKENDSRFLHERVNKKRKRIWLISSLLVLFVVFAVFTDAVYAQSFPQKTMQLLGNWAIALIAKMVVWIAEVMGFILIFLVDLLINIVQYNNFVNATPVQIGWPLIRDTVNMFFIVVVLVSAFATIIGYPKEFRYREVLPKLLLMAVLINFSKTLIGLMIDFSQVVLLTFVNGFKQAAGGNFVQALGIGKVMRLTDTTGVISENRATGEITITGVNTETSPWSLLNIVVSAFMAVWIISISITLILIMLIFFLARIIMLWFLLITSPIAFFAWSLPGSLKNALSSFTKEWWDRLSAALIGGPTMAFFLWLSLAMAQRHTDLIGPGGLYNPDAASQETLNLQTGRDEFIWPTEFGDPRVFSTFIIMVAFMLLGVQVSVKFASSVAPESEKLLKTLGAGSLVGGGVAALMAGGKLAGRATSATARTTGRVAYGGAKLAGKGALFAGGEVLKRSDFVQKQADVLRKDKLIQAVMPEKAQIAIGKFAGSRQIKAKEKETALGSIMSGMSATEKDNFLKTRLETMEKNPMPDLSEKMAINSLIARNASTELFKEGSLKENRIKAAEVLGKDASSEDIEAKAKQMTYDTMGSRLKGAYDHALANNNEEDLKKFQTLFEKNPNLMIDYDKRRELIADLGSNPILQNNISDDSFTDAFTAWQFMKERKWVDDEGRLVAGVEGEDDYKKFMRGRQGNLLRAHLEYAKTDQGKGMVKSLLSPAESNGKIDLKSMNSNNYQVSLSKNNKEYHVVSNDAAADKRYNARFDKTTDDPNRIFSDESLRNRANIAMSAVGANIKDIGRELSLPAQEEIVKDFEELKSLKGLGERVGVGQEPTVSGGGTLRGVDSSEGVGAAYSNKRDEIAKKYLQQGVSVAALLDHDKDSGSFRSSDGAESFERVMEEFLDKMEGNRMADTDVKAMASMLEQIGSKGDAAEKAMGMLADRMKNGQINQSRIVDLMRAGNTEQQKSIRKVLVEYVDKANKDDESMQSNTTAQILRDELRKQPQGGTTQEAREARIDYKRLKDILTIGKE